MNLRENIRKVLRESLRDELIKLINDYGIVSASRYVGGYDVIKNTLGEDILKDKKIDTIDDFVFENDSWFNLNQYNREFIYKIKENEEEQVEYLSGEGAVIVVYEKDGNEWNQIDEYTVWYGDLPEIIFDKIFDIVVEFSK